MSSSFPRRTSAHRLLIADELIPSSPDDGCGSEQENRRHRRRASDDEEVGCDRTDHRRREGQGTEHRERGYEQRDRRTDLDESCDVTEPLANADGVEHRHHWGGAEQLRAAGEQEYSRERNLDGPESDATCATRADRRCLRSDGATDMINLL